MDIFFYIAGFSIVVLTILLVIGLVYLIGFIRDLRYISNKAKNEADNLSQDIRDLRQNIKTEGFRLAHVVNFFKTIIKRVRKGK